MSTICATCCSVEQPCCDMEVIIPIEHLKAYRLREDAAKDGKVLERFIGKLRGLQATDSLREIIKDLLKERARAEKRWEGGCWAVQRLEQADEPHDDDAVYVTGDRIEHSTLGRGEVWSVAGDRITIVFDRGGRKELLSSFACKRMKKV